MRNWTPPHRLKVYCLHLSAIGEYVPPLRIELRIFSLRGSSFNHSAVEVFNCTEGRIWTHCLMDISHLHLPLVLPQHYKLKGCGRDSNPISSSTVKHFYQISYPHSSDNRTWTYNYCLMRAVFYLLKYIRILSYSCMYFSMTVSTYKNAFIYFSFEILHVDIFHIRWNSKIFSWWV